MDAKTEAFARAIARRTVEEEAHQSLIAGYELADARMRSGELSACDDVRSAQVEVAKHRRELEVARTHDRLAWLDWADGHESRTTELLAEIRDLLTKMANPPIMVSLESTPESRAASREAKREEAAEPTSRISPLVKQIAEGLKEDSVYKEIVDNILAREKAKDGAPVNDGSEAADDRDRALGREVSDAMSDGSEVTCKPIKTSPPSPFDVSLLAVEVAALLEIIRRGPCDYIQPAIKERLRELEFITPLYKRGASQFKTATYIGEVSTHAGRLWAQAGLAEPS